MQRSCYRGARSSSKGTSTQPACSPQGPCAECHLGARCRHGTGATCTRDAPATVLPYFPECSTNFLQAKEPWWALEAVLHPKARKPLIQAGFCIRACLLPLSPSNTCCSGMWPSVIVRGPELCSASAPISMHVRGLLCKLAQGRRDFYSSPPVSSGFALPPPISVSPVVPLPP